MAFYNYATGGDTFWLDEAGHAHINGNLYMTRSFSGATVTVTNLTVNGDATFNQPVNLSQPAGAPVDTFTIKSWMTITNSGVHYFIPCYQ